MNDGTAFVIGDPKGGRGEPETMARERERKMGPALRRRRFVCAFAGALGCLSGARADDAGGETATRAERIVPPPAEALETYPAKVTLRGAGAVEQVLVSAIAGACFATSIPMISAKQVSSNRAS